MTNVPTVGKNDSIVVILRLLIHYTFLIVILAQVILVLLFFFFSDGTCVFFHCCCCIRYFYSIFCTSLLFNTVMNLDWFVFFFILLLWFVYHTFYSIEKGLLYYVFSIMCFWKFVRIYGGWMISTSRPLIVGD